jgi:crossover junction endodeoxyribonuclease RusA
MPDAEVMFTFYPPDNRRRDIQNMPGMMKAYIDGIADAMGCDDHGFRPHFPSQFGATTPGGMVKVIVRSEAASVPIEGVVLPNGNVLK